MRIYIATLAALLIVFVSCREETSRQFSFKPSPDSLYIFFLAITDSSKTPGFSTMKRQVMKFTLRYVGQKDSLVIMTMVFKYFSITQPGIQVASTKNGAITVMPAGTTVTVSTDTAINKMANKKLFDDYYKTWSEILPKLGGDSLQIQINNRGEVRQVTGFDKIAERIAGESGLDMRTVRQYLRDYAGDESIRDLLGQLFFFVPATKIQVGNQWVKNLTTTANAPVKWSNLITVNKIDTARDEVSMDVQSEVSAKTAEDGRQYAEGKVTGPVTATYSTGMPRTMFLTRVLTTHTDQYDVINKRVIILRRPRI